VRDALSVPHSTGRIVGLTQWLSSPESDRKERPGNGCGLEVRAVSNFILIGGLVAIVTFRPLSGGRAIPSRTAAAFSV
jgi:hypothetical protein